VTSRAAIGELASREFDLLVIGAGIHGAFAALEAARRGYAVALVDRGDYGAATSANSMRVLHGGFRYLRSGDIRRLRESARERAYLFRAAPHLTAPLTCIAPTGTAATPGPLAFRAALSMYGLLGVGAAQRDDEAGLLDRTEYFRRAGSFAAPGATGGATWRDGFLTGAERLLMNVVRTAQAHGATTSNYAECEQILTSGGAAVGARVRDLLGDGRVDVRARCVLNAAGPWATDVAAESGGGPPLAFARGCNVIVRCTPPGSAIAVPDHRGRMLFAVPFGSLTLLGTWYSAMQPRAASLAGDVSVLLESFRRAAPDFTVDENAVTRVHAGMLPLTSGASPDDPAASLSDSPAVIDHGNAGGARGLVSLVGVKWTTGRSAAMRALAVAERMIGPSRHHAPPDAVLHGGDPADGGGSQGTVERTADPTGAHLARQYGSAADDIRAIAREDPRWLRPLAPGRLTIGAEIIHAIRVEQAVRLTDILLRRAGVGLAEEPPEELVDAAVQLAAAELRWSPDRVDSELRDLRGCYGMPR
jgi:glycerol-3-phosphate dehydrogenase